MLLDTQQRPNPDEAVRKIAAAYNDSSVAQTVVGDLAKAGMHSADITLMSPWPVAIPTEPRYRFLDHPFLVSLIGAFLVGGVAGLAGLLLANPERWALYAVIGAVVGAFSGSFASAVAATSPPNWHDQLLGDPLGAVTVEVNTTDGRSADVARLVMSGHGPALVQAQTEPGPRPPRERVLWQHEEGLSPLGELSSWLSSRPDRRKSPIRGRHLEIDRFGPH
jgi:hypothetical protein